MYKYRKPDTWLDKIDLNIMPYVDAPEWENRYPTISALLMGNANKRELQRISGRTYSSTVTPGRGFAYQ